MFKRQTDKQEKRWLEVRATVIKRDDYTCKMCNKRFYGISNLIADHILPVSIGGDNWDINNIQTLCPECNKIKTKNDMKNIAEYRKKEKKQKININMGEKKEFYKPIDKEINENFTAILRFPHKITVPYAICKKYGVLKGDFLTIVIKKFFREADEK